MIAALFVLGILAAGFAVGALLGIIFEAREHKRAGRHK